MRFADDDLVRDGVGAVTGPTAEDDYVESPNTRELWVRGQVRGVPAIKRAENFSVYTNVANVFPADLEKCSAKNVRE